MESLIENDFKNIMAHFESVFAEHPKDSQVLEKVCKDFIERNPEYKELKAKEMSKKVHEILTKTSIDGVTFSQKANAIYRFRLSVPTEYQKPFKLNGKAKFDRGRISKYNDKENKLVLGDPKRSIVFEFLRKHAINNFGRTMYVEKLAELFPFDCPSHKSLVAIFNNILQDLQTDKDEMMLDDRFKMLMFTETPITKEYGECVKKHIVLDKKRRILKYVLNNGDVEFERTYDEDGQILEELGKFVRHRVRKAALPGVSNRTDSQDQPPDPNLVSHRRFDSSDASPANPPAHHDFQDQRLPSTSQPQVYSTPTSYAPSQPRMSIPESKQQNETTRRILAFIRNTPRSGNIKPEVSIFAGQEPEFLSCHALLNFFQEWIVDRKLKAAQNLINRMEILASQARCKNVHVSAIIQTLYQSINIIVNLKPLQDPLDSNVVVPKEDVLKIFEQMMTAMKKYFEKFPELRKINVTLLEAQISSFGKSHKILFEDLKPVFNVWLLLIESLGKKEKLTAENYAPPSKFRLIILKGDKMKESKEMTSTLKRALPSTSQGKLATKIFKAGIQGASSSEERSILSRLNTDDVEVDEISKFLSSSLKSTVVESEKPRLPIQPGHTYAKDIMITLHKGVSALNMTEFVELEKELKGTIKKVNKKTIPIKTVISTLSATLKKAALPTEEIEDEAESMLALDFVNMIFPIALDLKECTGSFPFLQVLYKDMEKAEKWLSEMKTKISITKAESVLHEWISAMRDSS